MGLFGPAWSTDNPRKLDRAIASISRYAVPNYNEKMPHPHRPRGAA